MKRITNKTSMRYMRIKLRLLQEKLAQQSGVREKTLCRMETGCPKTSMHAGNPLSRGLSIPIYTLITASEPPARDSFL